MICHVCPEKEWNDALIKGFYEPSSLRTEGFIHASKKEQVAGVLQRYYTGKEGLILLHIDEEKLTAGLKYELSSSVKEMFPHIFGPLNIDAVVKTEPL